MKASQKIFHLTVASIVAVSLMRSATAGEEEPPDPAFLEFLAEFEDAETDEWIDPVEVGKWKDKRLDKEPIENEADELKAPQ